MGEIARKRDRESQEGWAVKCWWKCFRQLQVTFARHWPKRPTVLLKEDGNITMVTDEVKKYSSKIIL